MCELFGISSENIVCANGLLQEFFSHSERHRDGWGLAVFRNGAVSLEKEPLKALRSTYLRDRLSRGVNSKCLFAHIRKATVGTLEYSNCHPFVWDDSTGRTWTLMHNGTVFEPEEIVPYFRKQEGTTDSEGILLRIIDGIDRKTEAQGELTAEERFRTLDGMICSLAPGNKLNLMIYDGELLYVHTNYRDSLYVWQQPGRSIFATSPLQCGTWDPLPMCQLLAYRDGRLVLEGTVHGHEYIDEKSALDPYYMAYAGL
ncbi:MAG: class II glutamine amidotransferase [Mogibacterium sp.]|nr:class II glutamine amidotransferase [Mogibacterium sp.]